MPLDALADHAEVVTPGYLIGQSRCDESLRGRSPSSRLPVGQPCRLVMMSAARSAMARTVALVFAAGREE
jgi:hypothetical protein